MKRLLCVTAFLFLFSSLTAQNDFNQENKTYQQLMAEDEYVQALELINDEIEQINSESVRRKKIPSSFISFATIEDDIDVNKLFRERVLENFYLEENAKLHELHYNAGIAYRKTGEYEKSVSHLYDSLRYKKIEYGKDDKIFYELSQTYKDMEKQTAYHNALEFAFNMNPQNYKYSLELGNALYNTRKKQKSIYHLEQYLSLVDEESLDSEVYMKLAGLYIDTGKYLRTEEYYRKYLAKDSENGAIYFALGDISYNKTGNFNLALQSFSQALQYLEEDDYIKKSQCHEYTADIYKKRLYYGKAIESYLKAIEEEEIFLQFIDDKRTEIENLQTEIDDLKRQLLKQNDFVKYNEYQFQSQELERLKNEKINLEYQYKKFNSGERRWNLAECYERSEQYDKALVYYEESIRQNFNPNKARDRIKKIRLKLKRGY